MKRNQKLFLLALLMFLWFIGASSGCSWFRSQEVESAEELANKGMEDFQDEDYADALKTFATLKERYPYSRYAILAELKVADAHFYRQEYPEAIAAYDDFARLHPKNEVIPYVLYQIGACYYQQLASQDRDQSSTRQAILAFDRLIKAHPNTAYAAKAKESIGTCRHLLAEHEIYVGRFYYKSKHYKAALGRFRIVLSYYGDTLTSEQQQEVDGFIAGCEEKLSGEKKSKSRFWWPW